MNPQWREFAAEVPWIDVASALRLVICLRLTAKVPWDKYLMDPAFLVPNLRVILMSVLVQPVSDLQELLQIVLARDDPVAMATAVVLVRTHRDGAPILELPSVLFLFARVVVGIHCLGSVASTFVMATIRTATTE